MITIETPHEYKDLQDFMADPSVKILKQSQDSSYINYTFNTGETIRVNSQLVQKEKSEHDALIFGKDLTQNVVNISIKPGKVEIYQEINGKSVLTEKDYKPWVLSPKPVARNHKRLKGDQYYKYINFMEFDDYLEFTSKWQNNIYIPRTIEEGYLLLTGTTYFKGMDILDTSILSFDIEALSLDPNADNAGVVLITNAFRSQGKVEHKLFSIEDYKSDKEMIQDWCNWVRQKDPSILVGHNIFGYDLPYLSARGEGLNLSRDGYSPVVESPKKWKFRKDGSQSYEYTNLRVQGRELIDTFFLSIKYDIGRKFPSYGLKPIIEHLGMEKKDRVKWDFSKWPVEKTMKNPGMFSRFKDYAEADAEDALKLYDFMAPTFFYLGPTVPKTFQQIINEATGSQIDAFMVRGYLQDGYSQPRTSEKVDFQGAISFGIPGNYKNVFAVDFHALYPSIIKQYKLFDKKKDPNGHLLKATIFFTDTRDQYKAKYKQTGESKYDGMQLSMKTLSNSVFGAQGAAYLLYNSPSISSTITRIGRELLDTICKEATGKSVYTWKDELENKE